MNYIKLFEEFVRKTSFTPEEVKIFIDYFNPILAEGRKFIDEKVEKFLKSDSYLDHDDKRPQAYWVNYKVKWISGRQDFSDDYSRYVYANYSQETYEKLLGWAHLFYSLYDTFKRSEERNEKEKAKIMYEYKINCYIPSDIMILMKRRNLDFNIAHYVVKRLKRILGSRYSATAQVYDATNFNHNKKGDKYIQLIINITDEDFVFEDPFK